MKLKYHRQILRAALEDLVSREVLQAIEAANLGQDTLSNQLGHDEYHFDNNAFYAGWRYVRGQMRRVPSALRRGRAPEAWSAFGRLSHAVQDFYAHSNYVQLWLQKFPRRRRPRPMDIDPADVGILRHAWLRSGRLYYPLEAFSFIPGLRRLVLPLLPRDSHAHMNLDDPGQGEQFFYAYHAAVKQTRRLFLLLLTRLNRRERRLFTRKSRIMQPMDTREKLNQALKEALRSGDRLRKDTLRMVMAAIKQAEVDGRKSLDEAAVLAILQKQVKSRQETLEAARTANRPDLAAEAEAEIAILQAFLPEQMGADELQALAEAVIAEVGATSMRDMGRVMKALLPRVAGRAPSSQVSAVVRQLLSG